MDQPGTESDSGFDQTTKDHLESAYAALGDALAPVLAVFDTRCVAIALSSHLASLYGALVRGDVWSVEETAAYLQTIGKAVVTAASLPEKPKVSHLGAPGGLLQ